MIQAIDTTTGDILPPDAIRRRLATRRATWKRQDAKAGNRKPTRRRKRHEAVQHVIVACTALAAIVTYHLIV